MKKVSNRPRVASKGKKPAESGVMKPKMPQKTNFQKLLEGWPPKQTKKKKGK